MEAFSVYLFKSAVSLTAFALIYMLFLKNERFFSLKRSYLISGIIVSLVIPLIIIRYEVFIPATQSSYMIEGTGVTVPGKARQSGQFDVKWFAGVIYMTGIAILLLRIIWHMIRLAYTIRTSEKLKAGNATIIKTGAFQSSFSFLNFIFINPSVDTEESREILNHELVHVTQKHWFDLLLGELIRLMQWANPFAWIYAGFIRLNHEHMADRIALGKSPDPALYKSAILNQLFRSPVITISNNFSHSPVLTRFEMMKNKITSPYRKMKVLLVLPVLAFIMYSFATPVYTYQQQVQQGNVIRGIVQDDKGGPLAGAVISIEGTQNGAISDVNGRFVISNVSAGQKIIFSSKGFSTENRVAEPGKDLVVQLKKESVVIRSSKTGRSPDSLALIVIDGRKTNRRELDKMEPDEIESIFVLKDESAVSVYGEEGKDGVIIIKTKGESKKGNEPAKAEGNASVKEKNPDAVKEVVVIGYGNSPQETKLKIRNSGGTGNALVVIDGVKTKGEGMESIDPNTIESISVLKDQAAFDAYGEEGRNGVIIVTTKKTENLP